MTAVPLTDHGLLRTLEAAARGYGDDVAYAYRDRLITSGWIDGRLRITPAGEQELARRRAEWEARRPAAATDEAGQGPQ